MPLSTATNLPIRGATLPLQTSTVDSLIIADTASRLIEERGAEYAKAAAPRTRNPQISGNVFPMQTRLGWLAGRWKCNQFVGDALYEAGYRMPTVRMPDGSVHYLNAEKLPHQRDFFDLITNRDEVLLGDVLVIDYLRGSGENGAHAEVIEATDPKTGSVRSLGAHEFGAEARERYGILGSSSSLGSFWQASSARIYVLRPKRLLQ
jgi:hypothetical protein